MKQYFIKLWNTPFNELKWYEAFLSGATIFPFGFIVLFLDAKERTKIILGALEKDKLYKDKVANIFTGNRKNKN